MGFKKHNWMTYGRKGDNIEITIKSYDGVRLDFFRCDNIKDYRRILNIINSKYGFGFKPEVEKEESIDENKKSFLDKELDW